jgi:SAM-dependent methyltransferase
MPVSQEEIFAACEGDRWFRRNKSTLERFVPASDLPLQIMELYSLRPRCVLEIGAANGYRLAAISARYSAKTVAVELSTEAIRDGQSKFPQVTFVQGSLHALPLQEPFDLIIVNFVFHWVDRTRLLRSVAEVDRVLAAGGFLLIGDFAPANRLKVRYHHLAEPELYTYKQDYAATFLASGLYQAVCLLTTEHAAGALRGEVGEDTRIGVWLLRKRLMELYLAVDHAADDAGGRHLG